MVWRWPLSDEIGTDGEGGSDRCKAHLNSHQRGLNSANKDGHRDSKSSRRERESVSRARRAGLSAKWTVGRWAAVAWTERRAPMTASGKAERRRIISGGGRVVSEAQRHRVLEENTGNCTRPGLLPPQSRSQHVAGHAISGSQRFWFERKRPDLATLMSGRDIISSDPFGSFSPWTLFLSAADPVLHFISNTRWRRGAVVFGGHEKKQCISRGSNLDLGWCCVT